jgi:geranylgeranyl diphosphate synthase type I
MPSTEAGSTIASPASERDTAIAEISDLVVKADTRIGSFLQAETDRARQKDHRLIEPIEAIRSTWSAGGKRIRPMFCFAGYLAAKPAAPLDELVSTAVALELLHTCAIVHDDIIDASDERRGKPTTHMEFDAQHRKRDWHGPSEHFGTSAAILVGDLALIYSDHFMPRGDPLAELWFQLRTDLVLGQYMDVRATAENPTDARLARWVAVAKSAEYSICYPLVLGATLGNTPELVPFFRAYGTAVGEAFQLRDDLIDLFGDSRCAGKTTGQDVRLGKNSLVLTLGARRASEVRDMIGHPDADVLKLRAALHDSGVIDDVENLICDLVARGCASVDRAPMLAPWKQWMHAMARNIAYRSA